MQECHISATFFKYYYVYLLDFQIEIFPGLETFKGIGIVRFPSGIRFQFVFIHPVIGHILLDGEIDRDSEGFV